MSYLYMGLIVLFVLVLLVVAHVMDGEEMYDREER